MTDASTSEDLALALELADVADAITMPSFRAVDLVIETKPDLTPVTEADKATERAIRERLAQARPGDAVVGEEYGDPAASAAPALAASLAPSPDLSALPSPAARRWIVDPIDGTKSYVRGLPIFATLIALSVDDELEVAVVSAPALARRWWARRGHGAFADGTPIRVSSVTTLADAQLAWGGIEDWEAIGRLDVLLDLGRRCWRTRGVGDFWAYMLVAEGAAEIALDPEVSLWDVAAVQLIVEEAGGHFSDLAGARRADGGDALATNGRLHEAALAIVRR